MCFTGGVPSTSIPSLRTDSLQEENKSRRDDKPSSSHLSTLLVEIPDEEEPRDDYTVPREVHDQDAVYWITLSRAQDQGLRFWQTKSKAIIVHNLVPTDCIFLSSFSERKSNTIRKTLNPSTCAEGDTLEQLTLAAAAATLWQYVFQLREIGCGRN